MSLIFDWKRTVILVYTKKNHFKNIAFDPNG